MEVPHECQRIYTNPKAPRNESNFVSFIFACVNQVDADPEISAQEVRLAWVISQMLNKKTRVCFPLQSTLAKHLGVSDRAIRDYVAGLVALLRDDAIVSMPPDVFLTGPASIRAFLTDSVLAGGTRIRMVPISANRMPAFAIYSGGPTDADVRPYAVVLLDVDGPLIARMSVFADPPLVARFRLPASIAG